MLIVKLPEKSWYGDFQILLDVDSTFQLEADNKPKSKIKDMTQIHLLKAETLIKICKDHIQFRRFLVLRATMRRSMFI